jgi:hypothetical protein
MTQRAFMAYVGVYVLGAVLGLCLVAVVLPLWFGR